MRSMGGPGLPGGSVSNGPSGQSVSGMLAGTGMNPGFDVMHTGRVTSTVDPVSNPRGVIHTQYFLDTLNMNVEADVGNMELHWMDLGLEDGPATDNGMLGQKAMHVFKSWTAMNRYLQSMEAMQLYGDEKDSRWFNKRFSIAGILRHDDTANSGREHGIQGNVCQLFETGFRTTCVDIWQSFAVRRHAIGAEIGDLLSVVLRRYPYDSELNRVQGLPARTNLNYWQLIPYINKTNEDAPITAYWNPKDGSCGEAYRVGRVACIYGQPINVMHARAIARAYVFKPTQDGSYKRDLLKLRHLEIEMAFT